MAMSAALTLAVVGSEVDGRPMVAFDVHLVRPAGSRVPIEVALADGAGPFAAQRWVADRTGRRGL
jgi:hypothetical protein